MVLLCKDKDNLTNRLTRSPSGLIARQTGLHDKKKVKGKKTKPRPIKVS